MNFLEILPPSVFVDPVIIQREADKFFNDPIIKPIVTDCFDSDLFYPWLWHITILSSRYLSPERAHPNAPGYGVHACLDKSITLLPRHRKQIPLGFYITPPKSGFIHVTPLRKLALQSIDVIPMVIYAGHGTLGSHVIVCNNSDTPFTVRHGMKLALFLFMCHMVGDLKTLNSQ